MAYQAATSSLATQWDVLSVSNSLDPVGNPENSSTESDDSTATSQVVFLLHRLKAPKPSDFARKRKVASNPPRKGKMRCRGRGMNNPKSVSPSQRVKEHPNECLTVSNKQLFLQSMSGGAVSDKLRCSQPCEVCKTQSREEAVSCKGGE